MMKYVDEYRDGEAARKLTEAIARTVTRTWTIMEVCGGQTHTIVKYGIDEVLPPPHPTLSHSGGEGRVRGASSWSTGPAVPSVSPPWR
jgi:hydrogenase expression/formation protein HypD